MKNRVLVTTVSLLLSSTLSFAQEGRTVGKNHAGGPYQRGVKNPSYNRCDALAPTIMAGGSAFEDYIPIFGDAYYGAFLKAGHSYEVEVWNPFGEDDSYLNFRPQLSLLNGNCDPKDYIDVATIDPALNLGFSDRISWTQASDLCISQISTATTPTLTTCGSWTRPCSIRAGAQLTVSVLRGV